MKGKGRGEERRSHEAPSEVRDLQEPMGSDPRAGQALSSQGTRAALELPRLQPLAPRQPREGKKIPTINLTYTPNPQPLAGMRAQPRPQRQRGFRLPVLGWGCKSTHLGRATPAQKPTWSRRRGFGGAGSGLRRRGRAEALCPSSAPLTGTCPPACRWRRGSPAKIAWQLPTAAESEVGGAAQLFAELWGATGLWGVEGSVCVAGWVWAALVQGWAGRGGVKK